MKLTAVVIAVLMMAGGAVQAPSPTPWFVIDDPNAPADTLWWVMSTGSPGVPELVIGDLSQADAAIVVLEQDATVAPAGTTAKPWTDELDPDYPGRYRVVGPVPPVNDRKVGECDNELNCLLVAANANASR